MSSGIFDTYDYPAFTGTFKNEGVASDPETVKFGVKNPSGETTIYEYGVDTELQRVSTGVYTINILLDEPGLWHWRWQVTGSPTGAREGRFTVNPGQVVID